MGDYKIHVNDTPEKEDFLVVIVIDDKYKTEASFAMPRDLKASGQLRLIKSALAKVKFLNDTTKEEREEKSRKRLEKKLKHLEKKVDEKVNGKTRPRKK